MKQAINANTVPKTDKAKLVEIKPKLFEEFLLDYYDKARFVLAFASLTINLTFWSMIFWVTLLLPVSAIPSFPRPSWSLKRSRCFYLIG